MESRVYCSDAAGSAAFPPQPFHAFPIEFDPLVSRRLRITQLAHVARLSIGQMAILTCASFTNALASDDLEFFESKIRPVLVEHCYACHSEEAKSNNKLKGGLLLDTRQGLLVGGDSGPSVTPERPDQSLLISALRHEDFEMPPSGKLPAQIIDDFTEWVRRGAFDPRNSATTAARPTIDYQMSGQFWSFKKPKGVPAPTNTDTSWAQTEIDRFIKARMEQEGLDPVEPASPRSLLRRATFDLTGLPPSPEEMRLFLDASQETTLKKAYSDAINRLLSSTHYGERWGRHWLDIARYAEDQAHTFGVRRREHAHEYRDWVIAALNNDMPYDQFIKMQLAGDLMPDAESSPRTRLAGLGILGLGAIYYKNSDKAQAQADELDDRIDTITRGLLGLTVSCARCHDHKFDPIPTQDYYSLAGVFHNTRMVDKPLAPQNVVDAYRAAEQQVKQHENATKAFRDQRKSELAETQLANIHKYMAAVWRYRQRRSNDRNTKIHTIADETELNRNWLERWEKFLRPDNKYLQSITSLQPWLNLPEPNGHDAGLPAAVLVAAQTFEHHLRDCLDERDGKLDKHKTKAVYVSQRVDKLHPMVEIKLDLKGADRLFLVITDAGDGINSDWGDWINPRLVSHDSEKSLLDLDWKNATTDHSKVRRNLNSAGQPLKVAGKIYPTGIGTHAFSVIEYEIPPGYEHFISQGGLDGSGEGTIQFRIYTAPPSDLSPKKDSPERQARKELVKRVFSSSGIFQINDKDLPDRLTDSQQQQLNALEAQVSAAKDALPPSLPMAHVIQDSGTKDLHVYIRGDPSRLGPVAPRRFLRILTGRDRTPYTDGSGRLELANDIASPDNPLTARVIVNRVWQHHFGRGLVDTPSNFGTQGALPSHPELLDTLSVRFMKAGWSLKWLHREIMLSATYQLSSNHSAPGESIDPENRLLWRMNRRRLEVESWRDALLSVSGNLDKSTGGPTVSLDDAHNTRRTVYAAISRHSLHGLLRLFDFPDANVTSAVRTETIVPQQQLFVLNSEFFVKQAKTLAARVQGQSGETLDHRTHRVYQLLYGRNADQQELLIAKKFVAQPNPKDAKLTRWEQYTQALLGSNEFLYVD